LRAVKIILAADLLDSFVSRFNDKVLSKVFPAIDKIILDAIIACMIGAEVRVIGCGERLERWLLLNGFLWHFLMRTLTDGSHILCH
jgi:hypothetical protein